MLSNQHQSDRPAVLQAILAGQVLTATGIGICGAIFFLEVYAFIESVSAGVVSCGEAKGRSALWLFLITLAGLGVLSITCAMWWRDWTGDATGCQHLVSPLLPIIYILMKQFLYLFFYDRAKMVHIALKLNGKRMRLLRGLVLFSCTLGIPLATWWLFFLYWRTKVLPEGLCMEYFLSIGGVLAVAMFDFVLNLVLLALFVIPFVKHVRRQQEHTHASTRSLTRFLLRNTIVSCVLTLSTLIALVAMSVELSIVFGEHPASSLEHRQIWSTIYPLIDSVLTVILPHLLSGVWLPVRIQDMFLARSKNKLPGPSMMNESVVDQSKSSPQQDDRPPGSTFGRSTIHAKGNVKSAMVGERIKTGVIEGPSAQGQHPLETALILPGLVRSPPSPYTSSGE